MYLVYQEADEFEYLSIQYTKFSQWLGENLTIAKELMITHYISYQLITNLF
jgi:hypothetical protein